ncbi:MAG: hypothetical protein CM1200mP22_16330 [Dehalococcoidia bacterium]|nr:MAG: hypothetical protein CM1200mP22_16330 [Dehalococcoidia bacterium]
MLLFQLFLFRLQLQLHPTHPTGVPTATPEPPQELNEFGFVMTFDRGAYIKNLPTNTDSQGIVQLEYSGVNVILSWVPTDGVTLNGLISGTYDMLQGINQI